MSASVAFSGILGGGTGSLPSASASNARNAKQVAFHVDGEAAAKGLRYETAGALAQSQFFAGRNDDGFDVA